MSGHRNLSWPALRRATPARIGLGRSGTGLPTAEHLDFQQAHARARDAVHAAFDAETIAAQVRDCGLEPILLRSSAGDRPNYLRRPDLGRRLDAESRERLIARPARPIDVVFVIADGLSATAVHAHAGALLAATIAGCAGTWQGVANQRAARRPRAGTRHLLVGAKVAKNGRLMRQQPGRKC